MKKLFIILIASLILFSACSQDYNTQQKVDMEINEDEIETDEAKVTVNDEEIKVETEQGKEVSVETDKIKEIVGDNVNLTINENNETVLETENVTVTQKEDGTIQVEIDNLETVENTQNLQIEEWCVEGETFDYEQEETTVSSIVIGVSQYKDDEYCKAQSTTSMQGIEIDTIYYFKYGGTDVWVVTSMLGQTTELHING